MKMRLTASCRQLLRRASLPLLLYVLVSFVRKIYQSRKGWKLIHGLEDKRMAKIKKTLPKRFGMYPSSLWTPLLPIFLNGWLNMFYVMLLKKVIQDRFRREEIERPDGGVVSVDWLSGWGQESLPENAPLLLVLTTITGKSSDHSIWLRAAAQRGYRVCVFHRRGHDLPLKTPRFNIMGCADDAHAQVSYVRSKYNKSEFVAMAGLSAGSGLLITYLGRYAEETPVQAACCLCPAYEMNIWKMLDDKYPRVASHMLESVRNQWVRDNSDMLHSHDSKAAKAVERATSLSDFVEAHAPFTGDGDYSGWLVRSNPMKHFQKVQVPTFILNALDDPVSLADNIPDEELFSDVSNFLLLKTPHGSHVAYNDGFFGTRSFMMDRSIDFLDTVRSVSAEQDDDEE